MKKLSEINVRGTLVRVVKVNGEDYVCLTDMAKQRSDDAQQTISNWMRNRMTIEYLGLWESLYNADFNPLGFEGFRKEVGLNSFTMSPSKWIAGVNAIGIVVNSGRYGGTYARNDIAFKFASWLSVEFELYLVKEFQRLKSAEQAALGWSVKRELAKINYRIHTDAIQAHLIPAAVTRSQMSIIYANEADVLNVALFGLTHQQWQLKNPELKGNQRDYADVNQLICMANLENLNAVMIEDGVAQSDRLKRLNEIAIHQMQILAANDSRRLLK